MQEPKKLYKSSSNKVICGVCGGLAEYLSVDPTIVRLICALIVLAAGSGLLLYFIAALIMPRRPEVPPYGDDFQHGNERT